MFYSNVSCDVSLLEVSLSTGVQQQLIADYCYRVVKKWLKVGSGTILILPCGRLERARWPTGSGVVQGSQLGGLLLCVGSSCLAGCRRAALLLIGLLAPKHLGWKGFIWGSAAWLTDATQKPEGNMLAALFMMGCAVVQWR